MYQRGVRFKVLESTTMRSENLQRYKYNGKELDRMHGLNLYDYHARQYDGAGVRFTTMDPLCEKYNGSQSAHVIDKYKLISNNCTTFVSDVLNNNGSNVLNVLHFLPASSLGTYTSYEVKERFINPRSLLKHLYNQSHNPNSHVYKR